MLVVNDFMSYVDGLAVPLQRPFNDVDGAYHPRAKPARLGKNDAHYRVAVRPDRRASRLRTPASQGRRGAVPQTTDGFSRVTMSRHEVSIITQKLSMRKRRRPVDLRLRCRVIANLFLSLQMFLRFGRLHSD